MKRLVTLMLVVTFLLSVGILTSEGASYIGGGKCKMCHIKEYKSWQETKMATSTDNLKPGVKAAEKKKAGLDPNKDYTADAGCLKCHTTGYGKGGFKSLAETPELANVQCEGCHGPGGDYSQLMKANKEYKLADGKAKGLVIPSEDEKGCMECHGGDSPFNEKVDAKYKFNFKDRLKKTHEHTPLKYKH